MKMVRLFALASLSLLATVSVEGAAWTHSWETIGEMQFVDFRATHSLSDDQAKFLADNYAILSFEGCTGDGQGLKTEDGIYESAAKVKSINANVKTMFYIHVHMHKTFCYQFLADLDTDNVPKSLGGASVPADSPWLYDDNGTLVESSETGRPMVQPLVDYTKPFAREIWTSVPLSRPDTLNLIDGVFADGTHWRDIKNISKQRNEALKQGQYQMLQEMQQKLHAYNADKQLIGNGIQMYWAPYGMPSLDYMDGAMVEHFGVFEQVAGDGGIVVSKTNKLIELIGQAAAMDKTVLLSLFPGPVVQPIDNLGPSYRAGTRYETPTTFAGRRASLMQWHDYSLAAFLTVAETNVFMTYIWWYPIWDGPVSCPSDMGSCAGPRDWYPRLKNKIGAPLGPAVKNGNTYTREFEYGTSYLDLDDPIKSLVTFANEEYSWGDRNQDGVPDGYYNAGCFDGSFSGCINWRECPVVVGCKPGESDCTGQAGSNDPTGETCYECEAGFEVDSAGECVPAAGTIVPVITMRDPFQSSTMHGWDAKRGMNGDAGTCVHTNWVKREFWTASLGGEYAITGVAIRNRGDCCHDRINQVAIYVTEDFSNITADDERWKQGVPCMYKNMGSGVPWDGSNGSVKKQRVPGAWSLDEKMADASGVISIECAAPVTGGRIWVVHDSKDHVVSFCGLEVFYPWGGDIPTAAPTEFVQPKDGCEHLGASYSREFHNVGTPHGDVCRSSAGQSWKCPQNCSRPVPMGSPYCVFDHDTSIGCWAELAPSPAIDCVEGSDYTDCQLVAGTVCGVGSKTRQGDVGPEHGGASCSNPDAACEVPCPVPVDCVEGSDYTDCQLVAGTVCGVGTTTRQGDVGPEHGGASCSNPDAACEVPCLNPDQPCSFWAKRHKCEAGKECYWNKAAGECASGPAPCQHLRGTALCRSRGDCFWDKGAGSCRVLQLCDRRPKKTLKALRAELKPFKEARAEAIRTLKGRKNKANREAKAAAGKEYNENKARISGEMKKFRQWKQQCL